MSFVNVSTLWVWKAKTSSNIVILSVAESVFEARLRKQKKGPNWPTNEQHFLITLLEEVKLQWTTGHRGLSCNEGTEGCDFPPNKKLPDCARDQNYQQVCSLQVIQVYSIIIQSRWFIFMVFKKRICYSCLLAHSTPSHEVSPLQES